MGISFFVILAQAEIQLLQFAAPENKKAPERQRHSGARSIRGTTRIYQPLTGLNS